jgi:uncharacterized protein (DUF983 family)
LACGVCGKRGLFTRFGLFGMLDRCPRCGLEFERMEGQGLGAVAVNTVVSSALVLTALALALVGLGTHVDRWVLMAIVAPFGTVFPVLFDPFSRTLWTSIDLWMRPAGPDEVSPEYARTSDGKLFIHDEMRNHDDPGHQRP